MSFDLPPLVANTTGWGPPSGTQAELLPSSLKDLPYQPFNKSDRINRAADWTANVRATNCTFYLHIYPLERKKAKSLKNDDFGLNFLKKEVLFFKKFLKI